MNRGNYPSGEGSRQIVAELPLDDRDTLCCSPVTGGPYIMDDSQTAYIPRVFLDERINDFFDFINRTDVRDFVLADPRLTLQRERAPFLIKMRYTEPGPRGIQWEAGYIPVSPGNADGVPNFMRLYTNQTNSFNPCHWDEFCDLFEDNRYTNIAEDYSKVMVFKCPAHGREFYCRLHERVVHVPGVVKYVWENDVRREWRNPREHLERRAVRFLFPPSEDLPVRQR